MAVDVHLPVRMRVSARALTDHPDIVQQAFAQAFGRAVDRSATAIDETYGGYLSPLFDAPEFCWSGAALRHVSSNTRSLTEDRLARVIGTATRLPDSARQQDVDSPLSGVPVERRDSGKSRAYGRYRIDSYGGDQEVTLPADAVRGKGADRPMVRAWERAEVGNFDPAFVRQRMQGEAMVQHVTLGQVSGFLIRGLGNSGWTLILTTDGFAGDRTITINFGPQMRRQPIGIHDRQMQYREVEMVPPMTSASIQELSLLSDISERRDQLHDLMGASIATDLRDSIGPSVEQDNVLLPEELDALIAQEVEHEIQRAIDAIAERTVLLTIDWGDMRFRIALPDSVAARIQWNPTQAAILLPAIVEEQGTGQMPFGTGDSGDRNGKPQAHGGGRVSRNEARGNRFGTVGSSAGSGTEGHIFPALGGGSAMVCAPFLDAEPPLDMLPADGVAIRRLVAEIAERLDMVPCEYAATFCIGAAQLLAGRAAAVATVAGAPGTGTLTMPVGAHAGGSGNLGQASFQPTASRGIQLLRRLSQAATRIAELRRLIVNCYMHGEGRTLLGGEYYAHNPVGFSLRFEEAVDPEMREGVGEIFAQTCQLVMLQLLDTSAQQIAARQQHLSEYAPLFRDILVRRLSDIGTLTSLRDRLRAYEVAQTVNAAMGTTPGMIASATLPGWSAAARSLTNSCIATEGFAHLPGAENEIVTENGVARVRDAHGFMWTREALEQTIAEQRGQAETMDPLIQQLSDIPGTVDRFRRDPDSAQTMLDGMLKEMARLNEEKRLEAGTDLRFGLRVGRISENSRSALVPGLPYDLAGVHLIAHQQIYPFFGSETEAYARGVDHIFSVELGIEGITHFFTFTGLVLLAVLCAPAAFIAGVAVAGHEVDKAKAKQELYRALINPELVLNRTEVELELYIAYVGLALSLLPEAGTAARAISVGVRGAARRGAMVGLRLAGRSVIRHVSRQVTEQLARDMLPALVREFATNLLMEQVIVPAVVGPIIASIEREMQVHMSVGGLAGAERLIARIEEEAAQRAKAPTADTAHPAGGH